MSDLIYWKSRPVDTVWKSSAIKGVVIGKLWQPGHRVVRNGGVFWSTGITGADMSSDELRLQKALLEKR